MATCTSCNTIFNCDVNYSCWCLQYPNILYSNANSSCYCENCLKQKIINQSKILIASIKGGNVTLLEQVKHLPKSLKLIEGLDYYIENSFFVFTEWHHLRKGYCCKNGCRHCPY